MAGSLLEDITNFYKAKLGPLIVDAFADTYQFFSLINDDPSAAAKYGAQAFATIFSLLVVIYFLLRSLSKINKLLGSVADLIGWAFSAVKSSAAFAEERISEAAKSAVSAATSRSTLRDIISWCSMMDAQDEKRILAGFKDGPTQVKYQRNLGVAVLAVAIWSALAFGYAVAASATSFAQASALAPIAAIVGATLYGTLILSLDRSIVAPFTPFTSASGVQVPLARRIVELIYTHSGSLIRTGIRIGIALLVAKFTALPLTMLLLHGGIVEHLNKDFVKDKAAVFVNIKSITDERIAYVNSRANSPSCSAATALERDSGDRIAVEARQGCPKGKTVCRDKKTIELERQHQTFVDQRRQSCEPSPEVMESYALALRTANDRATSLARQGLPDVLLGATALEELARAHEKNVYFNPILATFYLLIAIELIPVLMKLWREGLVNRRLSGEGHSYLHNVNTTAPRRDRRLSELEPMPTSAQSKNAA